MSLVSYAGLVRCKVGADGAKGPLIRTDVDLKAAQLACLGETVGSAASQPRLWRQLHHAVLVANNAGQAQCIGPDALWCVRTDCCMRGRGVTGTASASMLVLPAALLHVGLTALAASDSYVACISR